MSPFEIRRLEALRLLQATGIRPSSYQPPLVSWLWRRGYQVPPPHFVPFGTMVLVAGAYFALAWGVLMGLIQGWLIPPFVLHPLVGLALGALAAGLLFGLFMAMYYAHGRRKHALPAWEDLPPQADPARTP